MYNKTVTEVIKWNQKKANEAKDPRDKARYLQNIEDLKLFAESNT